MSGKSDAGKGDSPRPCNIKQYEINYSKINWLKKKEVRTA